MPLQKIFFQKSGSVTFVPLWCTNFMQKIRKILRAVSEIFKDGLRTTDYYYGLRTDMGDYIGPPRINWGPINITNAPKMGFSPICDPPRFFFRNRALSLLYPYGTLTSCKKLGKSNEQSLRYLKTDGRTTDGPTDKGDY